MWHASWPQALARTSGSSRWSCSVRIVRWRTECVTQQRGCPWRRWQRPQKCQRRAYGESAKRLTALSPNAAWASSGHPARRARRFLCARVDAAAMPRRSRTMPTVVLPAPPPRRVAGTQRTPAAHRRRPPWRGMEGCPAVRTARRPACRPGRRPEAALRGLAHQRDLLGMIEAAGRRARHSATPGTRPGGGRRYMTSTSTRRSAAVWLSQGRRNSNLRL